jgi:hypothetical protein
MPVRCFSVLRTNFAMPHFHSAYKTPVSNKKNSCIPAHPLSKLVTHLQPPPPAPHSEAPLVLDS